MVFSWLTNQRRKRLLAEPMPAPWLEYLSANVRHYRHLSARRQLRIRQIVQVLVAEKNWEGGSGFAVSEEMKITVAGQAAVMVVGLKEPYYFDDVQSIIIYAGPYRHPVEYDRSDIAEGPSGMLGEAWYRGPIVLSWRDVLAGGRDEAGGHNLVFHEFAHYVDALDGALDGTPPLADRQQRRTWFRVTGAEYLRLVGQARRHEVSLLDHYGATNRAEFFAVATECFFEQPRAMWREHRQLYRVLRDFYHQHPARWLPDAAAARPERRAEQSKREEFRRLRHRAERLAVLRSRDTETLFALAVQYFNEQRYLLAAATATRVIALSPGDGEAFVQRASARARCGRSRAALSDANAALGFDPEDGEALVARGAAHLELGKYRKAKSDLDRALQLDEDGAELRYFRGRARMGLGDASKAVEDYSRSLDRRPFAAEVYYHRGLAQKALGNFREAKADLAKARQLDPRLFGGRGARWPQSKR